MEKVSCLNAFVVAVAKLIIICLVSSACVIACVSVSPCAAVFGKLHRLPPGPNAVYDEVLAGPEADQQTEAAE